jgi:hypothetical protein
MGGKQTINQEDKMSSTDNFRAVVTDAIGTVRGCNDGSGMPSFTISADEIEGMPENLRQWWDEQYENIECTIENAEEFFNETYPEII